MTGRWSISHPAALAQILDFRTLTKEKPLKHRHVAVAPEKAPQASQVKTARIKRTKAAKRLQENSAVVLPFVMETYDLATVKISNKKVRFYRYIGQTHFSDPLAKVTGWLISLADQPFCITALPLDT
ncbi:uncharacterized protein TRIREDRAFT_104399 [Trichoderma reesei QM6a]|uniref:Predicted protein n=2 Tax=Hypocrea jecorina TaxID=51453 RepID=G0RCA3_HYPJQ|nr:uncharacterized protein TRIREDRAFT_104399 [Trichoderma reesei QM6a]EGR51189.1 predicted protein [Trichoderma reesei QM6a]ETS04520.1 hypothetical protein M419DRAFT_33333 [Trichoderma reesei RUT C-30]